MENLDNILNTIKNDAIQKAKQQSIPSTNLYIDVGILNPGDIITAGQQIINITQPSIMVFADDSPLHNWSHPCRYILYDAVNGAFINEINARFPPHMRKIPASYSPFFEPISHSSSIDDLPISKALPDRLFANFSGQRYAVLFSGASQYRHVNDLQYLYNQLSGIYKFPPENIYVLNFDGTTSYNSFTTPVDIFPILDVPYSMPVNGAGTPAELNNVFSELKGRLKSGDLLFIHTNNHGDGPLSNYDSGSQLNMESSLCTYSPTSLLISYTASEFGEALAGLPKFDHLVVLMEQCHSGGFAKPTVKNSPAKSTCFMAACEYDQCSSGGQYFNPFTNAWTAGILGTGESQNASTKSFRTIEVVNSVQKAFTSAKGAAGFGNPVMHDHPVGCGNSMVLGSAE